jgi:hypothetical protein
MKLEVITKMATQLRTDYQRTVRDFLDLQVRGSTDGNGVVEQLRRALSVHGEAKPEALEAGLNTLATSDLRPTVPHVRTPTLVIAGQNDRITAPGASRVLATTLPDARYVEMRRAAHAPFLSHRKEFTAVLEQFLQTGDADTAAAGPPPTAVHSRPDARTTSAPLTAGHNPANAPVATAAASAGRSLPGAPVAAASPPIKPAATPQPTQPVRAAKKKRMKARARKKLQASTR